MFTEHDESQRVLNATYYRILWAGHMLVFCCFFPLYINAHPKSQGISHLLLKNLGKTERAAPWVKLKPEPACFLGLVSQWPSRAAAQTVSPGQRRLAALQPLSVLPDCPKVRASEGPAAPQVTDSLVIAAKCPCFPRHFWKLLRHMFFAPQLGKGPLCIPVRGNLSVSQREQRNRLPLHVWVMQTATLAWPCNTLLAPDTSLVMEPSAKGHVQILDSFLYRGKSICHETAGLGGETAATETKPCLAQLRHRPAQSHYSQPL